MDVDDDFQGGEGSATEEETNEPETTRSNFRVRRKAPRRVGDSIDIDVEIVSEEAATSLRRRPAKKRRRRQKRHTPPPSPPPPLPLLPDSDVEMSGGGVDTSPAPSPPPPADVQPLPSAPSPPPPSPLPSAELPPAPRPPPPLLPLPSVASRASAGVGANGGDRIKTEQPPKPADSAAADGGVDDPANPFFLLRFPEDTDEAHRLANCHMPPCLKQCKCRDNSNPNCFKKLKSHGIWDKDAKRHLLRLLGEDPAENLRVPYEDALGGGGGGSGTSASTQDDSKASVSGRKKDSAAPAAKRRRVTKDDGKNDDAKKDGDTPRRVPCGLQNLGATCYLNSMIQCLFMNRGLRESFYKYRCEMQTTLGPDDEPRPMSSEDHVIVGLQLIFARLQHSHKLSVDPTQYTRDLNLQTQEQQDVSEFNSLLLECINKRLQSALPAGQRTSIDSLFNGATVNTFKCSKCEQTSEPKVSTFAELLLPIKGKKSVEDCLWSNFAPETFEGDNQYMCSVCQSKQDAVRETKVKDLPPVLNLQLNRFDYDLKTGMKKKLHDAISIPKVIDLTDFMEEKVAAAAAPEKARKSVSVPSSKPSKSSRAAARRTAPAPAAAAAAATTTTAAPLPPPPLPPPVHTLKNGESQNGLANGESSVACAPNASTHSNGGNLELSSSSSSSSPCKVATAAVFVNTVNLVSPPPKDEDGGSRSGVGPMSEDEDEDGIVVGSEVMGTVVVDRTHPEIPIAVPAVMNGVHVLSPPPTALASRGVDEPPAPLCAAASTNGADALVDVDKPYLPPPFKPKRRSKLARKANDECALVANPKSRKLQKLHNFDGSKIQQAAHTLHALTASEVDAVQAALFESQSSVAAGNGAGSGAGNSGGNGGGLSREEQHLVRCLADLRASASVVWQKTVAVNQLVAQAIKRVNAAKPEPHPQSLPPPPPPAPQQASSSSSSSSLSSSSSPPQASRPPPPPLPPLSSSSPSVAGGAVGTPPIVNGVPSASASSQPRPQPPLLSPPPPLSSSSSSSSNKRTPNGVCGGASTTPVRRRSDRLGKAAAASSPSPAPPPPPQQPPSSSGSRKRSRGGGASKSSRAKAAAGDSAAPMDLTGDDDEDDNGDGEEKSSSSNFRRKQPTRPSNPKCIYDLTAILRHKGATPFHGHYTCDLKHEATGEWFHFDDWKVTKLGNELSCESDNEAEDEEGSPSESNKKKAKKKKKPKPKGTRNAYMLVYTQRDAKRFDDVPRPPRRIREFVERENREHRSNVAKYQAALSERNKRVAGRKKLVKEFLDLAPVQAYPSVADAPREEKTQNSAAKDAKKRGRPRRQRSRSPNPEGAMACGSAGSSKTPAPAPLLVEPPDCHFVSSEWLSNFVNGEPATDDKAWAARRGGARTGNTKSEAKSESAAASSNTSSTPIVIDEDGSKTEQKSHTHTAPQPIDLSQQSVSSSSNGFDSQCSTQKTQPDQHAASSSSFSSSSSSSSTTEPSASSAHAPLSTTPSPLSSSSRSPSASPRAAAAVVVDLSDVGSPVAGSPVAGSPPRRNLAKRKVSRRAAPSSTRIDGTSPSTNSEKEEVRASSALTEANADVEMVDAGDHEPAKLGKVEAVGPSSSSSAHEDERRKAILVDDGAPSKSKSSSSVSAPADQTKAAANQTRSEVDQTSATESDSSEKPLAEQNVKIWFDSPIDNSSIVCACGKLGPSKSMKRISPQAWEFLVKKCGAPEHLNDDKGGPVALTTADFCPKCFGERRHRLQSKTNLHRRITEVIEMIAKDRWHDVLKQAKSADDADTVDETLAEGFWVARRWLTSFKNTWQRQKVLSEFRNKDENAPSTFPENINEEITCPHGSMSDTWNKRRLVGGKLWRKIKTLCPNSFEISGATPSCEKCRQSKDHEANELGQLREMQETFKKMCPRASTAPIDYFPGEDYGIPKLSARYHEPYVLMPHAWMTMFQAYVKKTKRGDCVVVPGVIPMSELLCPHNKLKHCLKPKKLEKERDAHGELMVSEENLPGTEKGVCVLIPQSEFLELKEHFSCDTDVAAVVEVVRRPLGNDLDGLPPPAMQGQKLGWDDIQVNPEPKSCAECILSRARSTWDSSLSWSDGSLCITLLKEEDAVPVSSCPPGRAPGTGYQRRLRAKTRAKSNSFSVSDISSTLTISLLKMHIFQNHEYEPNQQTLFYRGKELGSGSGTLAKHKIRSGETLYMKIDEHASGGFELGSVEPAARERGFAGSVLGGVNPNFQEMWSCNACTYRNPPEEIACRMCQTPHS